MLVHRFSITPALREHISAGGSDALAFFAIYVDKNFKAVFRSFEI